MEDASKDIRVTTTGKIRSYVAEALATLPVRPPRERPSRAARHRPSHAPQHGPIKVHAQGPAVSKAVTVAEITKRRLRGLHQNTQIGLADEASSAAKPQPAISIVLSLQPLDPSQPGCARRAARWRPWRHRPPPRRRYQPPLTDEEMLLACVADEEEEEPEEAAAVDAAGASAAAAAPGDERAVVFLDIDGVLLPFGAGAPAAPSDPARQFPSGCLRALSALLEASGAALVLSSTWRAVPAAKEQIVANFQRFAADEPQRGAPLGRVLALDETTDPASHSERQWEIAAWLDAHPAVARWVALDDEELLEGAPNAARRAAFVGHVVQTQSHVGLTDELAARAVALLAAQPAGGGGARGGGWWGRDPRWRGGWCWRRGGTGGGGRRMGVGAHGAGGVERSPTCATTACDRSAAAPHQQVRRQGS